MVGSNDEGDPPPPLDPVEAFEAIHHGILRMASARRLRRCTECGEVQRRTRATTDYRESGLDNVKLVDVPVWECGNGHQEIEIPEAEKLHGVLVNALIRQPATLAGPEIRFLRKEVGMSGRVFARQLGMTAEHLSRLEAGQRTVSATTNLLVRLATAWELTRRRRIEFPSDLQPFVTDLEAVSDAGAHRVRYRDEMPRDQPWMSVSVLDESRRSKIDAPAVPLTGRILRGEEIDAGQGAQVLLEELLQPAFIGERIVRKLVDIAVNLVKEPDFTHPVFAPDALSLSVNSEHRRPL